MKRITIAALLAASIALSLAACNDIISPVEEGTRALPGLYVLGQKYAGGSSSSLQRIADGQILDATPSAGLPAHSNTGIDVADSILYLIDRTAGTVTGFLEGNPLSEPTIDKNVGPSSNPYNIARVAGRNWVARYGSAKILGFQTGSADKEIDLSGFNEKSASVPYAMGVKNWHDHLVVVLQRLDAAYAPADDSSLVLVLDPASGDVEKRIALPFQNPYDVDLRGDVLALGCAGGWASPTDGGLVLVDLERGQVSKSIPSTTLEGDPSSVAFTSDDRVWAAVDLGWPDTKARPVDISSGKVGALFGEATAVADLAFDGSHLWIANHDDKAPHVYALDPVSGAKEARYVATLAPGALKVLK